MYEWNIRLSEIKNEINRKIKLVNICYIGIKSDYKTINIQPILQHLSKEISIPTSEKFRFFDFESVKESILNSPIPSEEYKKHEIQRINDLEEEFKKFQGLITLMMNKKNRINAQYICGKYEGLKVIYSRDIKKIVNINEEIQSEKKKINEIKFGEGINECCKGFGYGIRGVIKRHNIIEESKEISEGLEKCFESVNDINSYINNLKIKCEPILDISKEMLTNIKFINTIDKMEIQDEDKRLIREYYNIVKSQ